MFYETETPRKIPHISGNENPKKTSYISGNGTFQSFPRNFLYFRKRKPSKYFLYFLAESFSYILGNGKIEEIPYVSEGTSKALKIKIYYTSPKKVMNKFFKNTFGL